MTMAGTPPKVVILSRSMSSRARSGSQWCIMTSFPPAAVLLTRTEWHPVAWKSGTDKRLAFWPPGARHRPWRPVAAQRSPGLWTKNRLMRLVRMLRWVPTAPLGLPVVPEV